MTTPPQGPYGPPTPPQSPYGPPAAAPGAPPQQPYGQPQQPYGYPQQPPAPPQHGGGWGQPGWGQQSGIPGGSGAGAAGRPPQGPQPPRRKRPVLIVGIVAGAVLAAGGIAYGVSQLVGRTTEAAFPEAEHKLVLRQKVLDGEFTLAQDLSSSEGKKIEDMYDPSVRDAKAVVGQYGSAEGGALVISGMYGRFTEPETMSGKMMEGGAEGQGATVAVPPKEFTPAGHDITLKCQVLQSNQNGVRANIPMCAWGDDNTGASVGIIRPETAVEDATAIDLEAAAAETAEIREEIRRPTG